MVLLGDEAQLDAHFSPFGDSANLDAKSVHGLRRTYYRLRNRLHAPDGTPRRRGSCGISFGPVGNGVSVIVSVSAG